MSRRLLAATGVLAVWATCNPRPATAQAAAMPPVRSRSFSLVLVSSMALRNSLRTNGGEEPYARTVYNTVLPGARYWSAGLAPALRTSRPHGSRTLELPVTYETAHTYHAVRPLAPLTTYPSPWPDAVFRPLLSAPITWLAPSGCGTPAKSARGSGPSWGRRWAGDGRCASARTISRKTRRWAGTIRGSFWAVTAALPLCATPLSPYWRA